MVFFTMAAVMLPMNLLGLCQYIAPFITLLLGVLFFAEPFGCTQALPLSFIWTGIAVYLMSDWVAHRHERKGERLK
jgi:chloramphenicol-sensitive protein RarD